MGNASLTEITHILVPQSVTDQQAGVISKHKAELIPHPVDNSKKNKTKIVNFCT